MRARKDFYEDLVLWSIISAGKSQRTIPRPTVWQRFLDDLCYLCDTKPGGKSVVSIAVSEISDHQYFFISANGGLRRAAEQLNLVLGELHGIRQKSDHDIETTKQRLLDIGIRGSSMKVRNYVRKLQVSIRNVEHLGSVGEGEQISSARSGTLLNLQANSRWSLFALSWLSKANQNYLLELIISGPAEHTSI
ncbi:hypothetical protein Q7P37_009956 [Cladosporium fusiforme]